MRDTRQDGPAGGDHLNRRCFMRCALACGGYAAAGTFTASAAQVPATGRGREALHWEAQPGGATVCNLCPNRCRREPGGVGICRTRVNRGGRLVTLAYGNPCVVREDPLSKNPLFHVDPGAAAIGVATAGCNLACKYCQNWDISQVGPERTGNFDLSPAELAEKARSRGLKWITFSYTEPVAYFEYALDAAGAARAAGLRVAVVTAGFIAPAPLKELIQVSDAFSITLKGHSDAFYRDVCGGRLNSVLESLETVAASRRWLEVVYLVVPGLNDSPEALESAAQRVAAIGMEVPLHFLRFAPAYKLKNLARTPLQTLETARGIARARGLKFVYLDIPGHAAANTECPRCGKVVIERVGFAVISNRVKNRLCPFCSCRIPGLLV